MLFPKKIKFIVTHLCWSLLSNKVGYCRAIETSGQVFSRTVFFIEHLRAAASQTNLPAGNYMFKVNNRKLEQGVKYVQS